MAKDFKPGDLVNTLPGEYSFYCYAVDNERDIGPTRFDYKELSFLVEPNAVGIVLRKSALRIGAYNSKTDMFEPQFYYQVLFGTRAGWIREAFLKKFNDTAIPMVT